MNHISRTISILLILLFFLVPKIRSQDTLKEISDLYIEASKSGRKFRLTENYYLTAIEKYKVVDSGRLLLKAYLNLADYYRYSRKKEQAGNCIEQAEKLLQVIDDPNCRAEMLYTKAAYDLVFDTPESSKQKVNEALDIISVNQLDINRAKYYYLIGDVYGRQMNCKSALLNMKMALDQLNEKYSEKNIYHVYYLDKLGEFYSKSFQFRKAANSLNEAKNILTLLTNPDPKLTAYLYQTTANFYLYIGEYKMAEISYRNALQLLMEIGDRKKVCTALGNIAFLSLKSGNPRAAIDIYQSIDTLDPESWPGIYIKRLTNMAICYKALDSVEVAWSIIKKALGISIKEYGENSINTAKLLDHIGILHKLKQDHDSAIIFLRRAYDVYEMNHYDNPQFLVSCLVNLGESYFSIKEYEKAMKCYNAAIDKYLNPRDQMISNLGGKYIYDEFLVRAYRSKGRLLFFQGINAMDPKEKLRYFRKAMKETSAGVKIFDLIRNSFTLEDSKLSASEKYKSLYNLACSICYNLYLETGNIAYWDSAFIYVEKYRSSVLRNELEANEGLSIARIPDSLVAIEKTYKNRISTLRTLLHEETTDAKFSPGSAEVQKELCKLLDKQERLQEYIETTYDDYYEIKYANDPVGIKKLQSTLEKGQGILEYFVMDSLLLKFFISENDFELTLTPLNQNFEDDIEKIFLTLSSPETDNIITDSLVAMAHVLQRTYELLFRGIPQNCFEELIIVPDKYLSYLPFEILLTAEPKDYAMIMNYPFLLREKTISYAYSSSLYADFYNDEKIIWPEVLGFAPVYENGGDVVYGGKTYCRYAAGLPTLPESGKEIRNVEKSFSLTPFIHEEATESLFKKHAPDFDMIHLAMHSVIDSADSFYSKLLFYPDSSRGEDGLLNVREIYNLGLRARLVVLSGCGTGYGELNNAEGLISMARSFYYGGCPSALVNLWQVEDKASKMIYDRFYEYLSQGFSRAEALRMSKLDFLNEADPYFAHPHFWSGFVLMGQNTAIVQFPFLKKWMICAAVGMLLFLFIGLVYRRVREKVKR